MTYPSARIPALFVLAACLLLLAPHQPVGAISDLQTAYWWVGAAEDGEETAPAQVPPGGLYVSSNPFGPQAVAAVSFTLAADETSPKLVLRVSNLQQLDDFRIQAYPATGSWSRGGSQTWSSRPEFDDEASAANGVVSDDGGTVTFDIIGVSPGQRINLVLVPGMVDPSAPTAVVAPYPTFDVSFEKLVANDIQVATVGTTTATTETPPRPDTSPPVTGIPEPVTASPPVNIPPPSPSLGGLPTVSIPADIPEPSRTAPEIAAPAPLQPPAGMELAGTTRSARDTFLLGLLLGGVVLFLAWQAYRAHLLPSTRPVRVSIYDPGPEILSSQEP